MSLQQIKTWLLILFITFFQIISTSPMNTPYRQHCNSIVPESISTGEELDPSNFLQFQNGFYKQEDLIAGQNHEYSFFNPSSVKFVTMNLYRAEAEGVLKVEGILEFRGVFDIFYNIRHFNSSWRNNRFIDMVVFNLQGFWSDSSEKLCMVGSANEGTHYPLSAVLKLNYPKNPTISSSLVTGSLKCLDKLNSENYFGPISILGFSQGTYQYTLLSETKTMCSVMNREKNPSPDLGSLTVNSSICDMISRSKQGFRLEYDGNCSIRNCNPFSRLGFLPNIMFVHGIECSGKEKLHFSLGFSNIDASTYEFPLFPEATLVGEGMWDKQKNQLCMVGCHLLNFTDSLEKIYVGDCTIGLSLRFPETLTIRNRDTVLGLIWSKKNVEETGFFERIVFGRLLENPMAEKQGLEYKYTEMGPVMKQCGHGILPHKKDMKNYPGRYPDGSFFPAMMFHIHGENILGKKISGYATPLTKGRSFYEDSSTIEREVYARSSDERKLNVSYSIRFFPYDGFNWRGIYPSDGLSNFSIELAAEGIYDSDTGMLCMMGCRYVGLIQANSNRSREPMDCEILINVQFPPSNSELFAEEQFGIIRSTRGKSDPNYFEPLKLILDYVYASQSVESIWRMDLEIVMVLISLTFASIFISLQIFYIKRHPDVLPSISVLMLVLLTLGYMIPLVMSFEKFLNDSGENVLDSSGRWIEANEVIVISLTMICFLLQSHLLQSTWSSKKGSWVFEIKSICSCLMMYLIGGFLDICFSVDISHSLWENLRSYTGLIVDFFLLPQSLLGFFLDSKQEALCLPFYIGTTIARSLPHAYDIFRTGRYIPEFLTYYYYANPGFGFYSSTWDVIIPCVGLVFSILVYFQQRFGGRFILPPRFREFAENEKVAIVAEGGNQI